MKYIGECKTQKGTTKMRHSSYLPKYKLAAYGVMDVFFSDEENTWVIKRRKLKANGEEVYSFIKAVDAKQPRTYAPIETRLTVFLSGKKGGLPHFSTTLARVYYAWFIDSIPADYCVMFKNPDLPLKDLYSIDNLYLQSNEEVDKTKIRGNQYYSEKWNIVAKKYEGKEC